MPGIQNDDYFHEAWEWYTAKYLYPYTHFTYTLLIAIVAIVSAIIIVGVATLKYTTKQYPFPMYIDDQVYYFYMIKGLAVGSESINLSIARYLVTQYVIAREEYNHIMITHNGWQETINRIKATSSRRVFDQYIQYSDPKYNPNSPLLSYKLSIDRSIEVLTVTFSTGTTRPSEATVQFRAIEKGQDKALASIWEASLSFSMSNIDRVVQDQSDLSFVVTDYSAKLIRNE